MNQENWELLAKYHANELSDTEQLEFEGWLASSSKNQELLKQTRKIFAKNGTGNTMNDQEWLAEQGTSTKEVWQHIENRIGTKPSTQTPWLYRSAAAIALIVGMAAIWTLLIHHSGVTTLQTGDETESFELADGSTVWLNKKSKLIYYEEFGLETRKVTLEGEAFFEVARNEDKPFIIDTEHTQVEVLGTSFNVNAITPKEPTTVSVASGKVSFRSKDDSSEMVFLTKGHQGTFDPLLGRLTKSEDADPNYLSWKTGILTFKNQDMSVVLKTLSRHYGHRITTDHNELLSKSLTATFDNQGFEEVLKVVCAVHNLTSIKEKGQIKLIKNSSQNSN